MSFQALITIARHWHPPLRSPALLLTVWVATLGLGGCQQGAPVTTNRFNAFGEQVDLSLVRVSPDKAKQITASLKSDFAFMERVWHAWEPGPMGRVNQLLPSGKPFVAPPSVMPLVRLAKVYSAQSGGLFNPATGRLSNLWGFHAQVPQRNPPPNVAEVRRLVSANPRMEDIRINGLEVTGTNPALRLDLGPLVKAYAIDHAMTYLHEQGVRDAEVRIGGAVRAIGDRGGQPWRVPIRRPSGSGVLAVVQVRGNESVVTVAAYDRNFIHGGTTYHNILDPRTGAPARDIQAVTVLHGDATKATAAATALFVAGPDHWHQTALAMGIRYALVVDAKGSVHLNPELQARMALVDERADLVVGLPLTPAPTAPAKAGPVAGGPAGT